MVCAGNPKIVSRRPSRVSGCDKLLNCGTRSHNHSARLQTDSSLILVGLTPLSLLAIDPTGIVTSVTHADATPWSASSPPRLLASRVELSLYVLAWTVFTVGFAAVFWLQSRQFQVSSLTSAARVMLPAALLGIAVVRLSERVSVQRMSGLVTHAAASLVFPAAWIAAVNVTNNMVTYFTTGTLRWRLPPEHVVHWHYLAGVMIYSALAALTYGRARVLQAERKRLLAEWRTLRGQLSPHFLFNTLHTVFGLAQIEPAASEAAMNRFSRVLRYTLLVHREDRDLVPLRDEWGFTEDYLHLELLRHEGRLTWRSDVSDDVSAVPVPALLIQPLVENAIRHGGVAERGRLTVTVDAHRTGDTLAIRVADDGRGSTMEAVLASQGVGLRAARARVHQLNRTPEAFSIETHPGQGFAVTMRIPIPMANERTPDGLALRT